MSVLFCDTNCELWWTRAEELGLQVIKMPFSLEKQEYFYDLGKETDFDWFYKEVRNKKMPITSALNAEDYKGYFEPFFRKGEDILYISFSSEMSGTFNYMDMAVNELSAKYPKAKFRRYDTKSISMGAGLQVYLAAKLWRGGASTDDVIKYLDTINQKVGVCFVVDDLNHLKRGGRLKTLAAVFGTMLSIKPVLKVNENGQLYVCHKEKGRNMAINYMYDYTCENVRNIEKYPICILHADCAEDAEKLKQRLLETLGEVDIWVQPVGPVVGTHCGPGTLGIVFMSEDKRSKQ